MKFLMAFSSVSRWDTQSSLGYLFLFFVVSVFLQLPVFYYVLNLNPELNTQKNFVLIIILIPLFSSISLVSIFANFTEYFIRREKIEKNQQRIFAAIKGMFVVTILYVFLFYIFTLRFAHSLLTSSIASPSTLFLLEVSVSLSLLYFFGRLLATPSTRG